MSLLLPLLNSSTNTPRVDGLPKAARRVHPLTASPTPCLVVLRPRRTIPPVMRAKNVWIPARSTSGARIANSSSSFVMRTTTR